MTDIFGLLKGKPGESDYENKGVIVQGITGSYGSLHAGKMLEYGTNIVAGVTPGKGDPSSEPVTLPEIERSCALTLVLLNAKATATHNCKNFFIHTLFN